MSAALYIVLDRDDAGIETDLDGISLSIEAETLSAIAVEAGIADPMHYVSVDDDDLAALMEDIGDVLGDATPEQAWFPAGEGCTWVAALQRAVETNASRIRMLDGVRADLARLAEVLVAAKEADARWHLAVDY